MLEGKKVETGLTPVALWCLPSLFAFLGFLSIFLISRNILFLEHPHIAEGLSYWSIAIAPAAIVVAMARLKHSRSRKMSPSYRAMAWGLIGLSIFMNGFALAGLGIAFYS